MEKIYDNQGYHATSEIWKETYLQSKRQKNNLYPVEKNPFMIPRELQNSSQGLPKASIWTVKRALSHSFLFGRIGCKKPLLTKASIAWCKAYQNMTDDDWQNVAFTDECRFETFANRRMCVRYV